MKMSLTKLNTVQIDPNKKYLVLVTNKDNMLMTSDIDDMNRTLSERFCNNITVVALPDGVKYKVVEGENETK